MGLVKVPIQSNLLKGKMLSISKILVSKQFRKSCSSSSDFGTYPLCIRCPLNNHADVSLEFIRLNFGLCFYLQTDHMYESSGKL